MTETMQEGLTIARRTIVNAEKALGRMLDPGEYVDLIADKTNWPLDFCRVLAVAYCVYANRFSHAIALVEYVEKRGSE